MQLLFLSKWNFCSPLCRRTDPPLCVVTQDSMTVEDIGKCNVKHLFRDMGFAQLRTFSYNKINISLSAQTTFHSWFIQQNLVQHQSISSFFIDYLCLNNVVQRKSTVTLFHVINVSISCCLQKVFYKTRTITGSRWWCPTNLSTLQVLCYGETSTLQSVSMAFVLC